MDCRQARKAAEQVLDGKRPLQDFPELEEHLEQCAECRAWYAREQQTLEALQQLEVFPAPPDFAERVLSRLPDRLPKQRPGLATGIEPARSWLQGLWDSLLRGLTAPAPRRRLVPVLATAASLLLVLGLVYVLWGGDVTGTPGAATGASSWAIGIGVGLFVVVLVAALVLWRRKE